MRSILQCASVLVMEAVTVTVTVMEVMLSTDRPTQLLQSKFSFYIMNKLHIDSQLEMEKFNEVHCGASLERNSSILQWKMPVQQQSL